MFHPVVREITRALRARRNPPPPFVPPMKIETVRRYAYAVLEHPARREIAESLLVVAMRLDVLGFTKPRNQLLLLVGCGLSAADITDSLERRRASETGAQKLMEKARSTSATAIERLLADGIDRRSGGGVSLREQHRTTLHSRKERLRRSKEARAAATAPKSSPGQATVSGKGPRPKAGDAPDPASGVRDARGHSPSRRGRQTPPGSSGAKGPRD